MTDQQRADFTRAAGFPLDTMLFLDALGAGGVRFERVRVTVTAHAPSGIPGVHRRTAQAPPTSSVALALEGHRRLAA